MSVRLLFFIFAGAVSACVGVKPVSQSESTHETVVSGLVSFERRDQDFLLFGDGQVAVMAISDSDHAGVIRAFGDLRTDIGLVTGMEPELLVGSLPMVPRVVIAGTVGQGGHIDDLVRIGRLDVSDLKGRWEMFRIQVVSRPFPGVEEALVIAGSDKRGTIYGIYELSRQIGVSPWQWWADVPVERRDVLSVWPKPTTLGEPAVRYRGIFINNENPSLLGWVNHTFGGFNHSFYSKVYELILRNRGNYLWPAMWGKALHDDDPLNAQLADEYGVVIGYTHHEPMARAHVEWARYGTGPWNYETNGETLRRFWTEGIERLGTYESSVTLGMRGDGDEPMSDEANIALMQRIIADQRAIIDRHSKQDPSGLLQIWALYKEVQEYYEKGLSVPDDVLILLANDNWGNIRLLPDPSAPARQGGWGMYYHFDYVGGPRNYKWVNTVQIARIWEQMGLAYAHGVDRLWLVNVGDIKPMEYPISFFLDYAWNPEAMSASDMDAYPVRWAADQFGQSHAVDIGHILTEYTRYNSRRKPELLNADTYSLDTFSEWDRVMSEWKELVRRTDAVKQALPAAYHDAYFQLVEYPVKASANINALYHNVALNRREASGGRLEANAYAAKARWHFAENSRLDSLYHHVISGGKWRHMMDQTRIGYTDWQQPETNVMPVVEEIDGPVPALPERRFEDRRYGKTERSGILAMEAAQVDRNIPGRRASWNRIPQLGRTSSSMAPFPVLAPSADPVSDPSGSARLEYDLRMDGPGDVTVTVYLSPTKNYSKTYRHPEGIRFALSMNDETPVVLNMHAEMEGEFRLPVWERWVADNIITVQSTHRAGAGANVLKLWMVDTGTVVQKITVHRGSIGRTYLGPPSHE